MTTVLAVAIASLLGQNLQGPVTEGSVSVRRVASMRSAFAGNVIADPASGRAWLMSYGPPAADAPTSVLYEVDLNTGRTGRPIPMPFKGRFGAAAVANGSLYQVIPYESRLYEIAIAGPAAGQIVRVLALPTYADVRVTEPARQRFPFIAFTDVIAANPRELRVYASDLGEIITLDAQNGRILKRVPTAKGLSGIVACPAGAGGALLLASFEPGAAAAQAHARRYAPRAPSSSSSLEASSGFGPFGHPARPTTTWLVIDGETGEVLAATALESAMLDAGSIAIPRRADPSATGHILHALTLGKDGLYAVDWQPLVPSALEEGDNTPDHHSALVASIMDALAPRIRTLTRPVYTYHYAMRRRIGVGDAGFVAATTDRAWQYVTMKIARYWDLSIPTHPNATVSGLYVATDPVIARAFGGVGDVWGMIQVELDAGFRFVDVRRGVDAGHRGDTLPAAVRGQLSSAGCDAPYADVLVTFLESSACREVAVAALDALHVDGILYSFQRYPFDECDDRADGGFIIVSQAAVTPQKIRVFVPEFGPDTAAADRLRIRALFLRARMQGSRRSPPWTELAGQSPPSMNAWMRTHLFGCGSHAEDRAEISGLPRNRHR